MIGALLSECQADKPAAVPGHEIDGLRGYELGSQGQVTLVLAIFVVDHNYHASGANLGQCAGNVSERGLDSAWGLGHVDSSILAH
jgi:hypothetical protein